MKEQNLDMQNKNYKLTNMLLNLLITYPTPHPTPLTPPGSDTGVSSEVPEGAAKTHYGAHNKDYHQYQLRPHPGG